MHKKLIILAAVALAALAACTQEPAAPENPSPSVLTLQLGTESLADGTRAAFENDQTFFWQAGDQVGAYMYSTTLNNVPGSWDVEGEYGPWMAPFTLTGGEGTGVGKFSFDITYPENGEAVGGVAVYPFCSDNDGAVGTKYDKANGTLYYVLPQYWMGLDNLDQVRIPMVANLDTGSKTPEFKHVGGAVKVTLLNVPAGARYFKLSADKNISGTYTIRQSDIGTGVLQGDGLSQMVELQLKEGAGKALKSVDVYFPVPAGTYTFSLGVYGDGVVYLEKEGKTANTIKRGTILKMPAVNLDADLGDYDPDLPSKDKQSGLIYQLNVYSFADSNGDGWGDFQGIIDHLDYLDALGVTALWLSPIHPAQSYHGYDILDYDETNSRYGTRRKFKQLVKAAHERNIRIYLDYVINHTGNEHTWFLDCKNNGPSSPYWNYYAFSKDPQADCYAGLIDQIPQGWYDTGKWFPLTLADGSVYYYYSEFATGMFADFNYGHGDVCANSEAFQAVVNAIGSWLECGVDGLRLDAVKHIYADESGYENIQFWKAFYNAINTHYATYAETREDLIGKQDPNIFMVGECLSSENVCRPFYEGLPSVFDFDFWWGLKSVLINENGSGFVGGMCDRYYRHLDVRSDAIYTPKLSNHDEDRTAHELSGYTPKIRLAASILLTSPGRPIIYQGEELGYWGHKGNGDEYVRAPILWNSSISSAATKGVNNKYDAEMLKAPIDVKSQEENSGSLLMHYRRFAYARNINPALADGHPEYDNKTDGNSSVLCWYMHANDNSGKSCLVMHNVTGSSQTVERWEGDNLSKILVASDKITVSGNKVTMAPYSSVVFALN